MVFSSMLFLWVFLPITLILYYISDLKLKNIILLLASMIFYSWGEPKYIILMIISVIINYIVGINIGKSNSTCNAKSNLIFGIIINIGILGYFKYFNFFVDNINFLFKGNVFLAREIVLPIGISFYTFQIMSYIVDVYRDKTLGKDTSQKNIFSLALYISLFPQLIAGPIVKYHDIENQIKDRSISIIDISYGIKRFIYGLGKKVIIANSMAKIADNIFAIQIDQMGTFVAWSGIICYTLQIYFDFSGYSDMAIGLGRMFGFRFLENFNYPYTSISIQDFWRRWHISLSTWFKEYLYIPLGGSKKTEKRTYINLIIVFFATGIWHGASWNFIVWGLFHGFFIVLERLKLKNILKKSKIVSHIYVVIIFMLGWVFFRANNLSYALKYISKMFVFKTGSNIYNLKMFWDIESLTFGIIGILLSGIVQRLYPKVTKTVFEEKIVNIFELLLLIIIFTMSILNISSGTYNPFIYFRF